MVISPLTFAHCVARSSTNLNNQHASDIPIFTCSSRAAAAYINTLNVNVSVYCYFLKIKMILIESARIELKCF